MRAAPIRVLYTIPNVITAGGAQVLSELFEHLDRSLVTPMVCVALGREQAEARFAGLDVSVVEIPFTVDPRPLGSLPSRARATARGFADVRADIWHSWHYIDDYTEPLIARLAGNPRWVFTKKSMAWRDRGWQVRTALASGIVAMNSDMVEQFFGAPWLRRHTQHIPLGMDPRPYDHAPPVDLEPLGVPPGAPVVTTLARIHRGKTIEVAIRAMAATPHAHLVVAGRVDNEEYEGELRQLTDDLGLTSRVHLVGAVSDVPGLLAASDVFVMATGSDGEGGPVALLEAMATRLACVATDTAGNRDLMADRRTGLLVPVGDDRAMGEAVQSLLEDPDRCGELGRAGRDRVVREYTLERSARAHERFYQQVMARPTLLPTARRNRR